MRRKGIQVETLVKIAVAVFLGFALIYAVFSFLIAPAMTEGQMCQLWAPLAEAFNKVPFAPAEIKC
ncbi:MAG: hypothetical protein SVQ76_01260 [Candidatus Nanohaloarchaea archaeon]|nr:hypothetical protein [Candidatus Nanohaloarchaea archaeon]